MWAGRGCAGRPWELARLSGDMRGSPYAALGPGELEMIACDCEIRCVRVRELALGMRIADGALAASGGAEPSRRRTGAGWVGGGLIERMFDSR